MVEPLIKGTASLEYLRKAFSSRHGSASDASISLPITRRWLSSVRIVTEEEWHEYVDSLSALTSDELSSGLAPTTLRTGGSSLVGTKIGSQTSSTTDAICRKKLPECKGERIDLLIRLGLLNLVIEVGGLKSLNLEVLPETLVLNLPRLRAVQSRLQKIIVISSWYVYTFGGNEVKGRELAEASLRRIGAALLVDDLVKAAEVLVVVAVVSCHVHRPWYEELLNNI